MILTQFFKSFFYLLQSPIINNFSFCHSTNVLRQFIFLRPYTIVKESNNCFSFSFVYISCKVHWTLSKTFKCDAVCRKCFCRKNAEWNFWQIAQKKKLGNLPNHDLSNICDVCDLPKRCFNDNVQWPTIEQ